MNAVQQVRVGVAAFIVRPSDGAILLNHRIGKHGYGMWGLCGGHQEFGESPLQTMVREHKEEVGLTFTEADFTPLGFCNDIMETGGKHYVTLFYAAKLGSETPIIAEPHNTSELRWALLDEFPENLFQPLETFLREQRSAVEEFIQSALLPSTRLVKARA